jgi:iron complex transport system ATP-binding protein
MRDFIEIEHVSVLRGEREILSNINLTIKIGENVAIIGPNGSGKSTFIKLITRSIYPYLYGFWFL